MNTDRFSCATAHAELVRYSAALVLNNRKLDGDTALLARLGITCVAQSSQRAVFGRTETTSLRAWDECGLGEAQLRTALFRCLRGGGIDAGQFDHAFSLMKHAALERASERIRLRQRILYQVY
jgi:hypothetical protein